MFITFSWTFYIGIFCFIQNFQYGYCQTGTNLQDLLTNLFTTNNYNIYARPSTNQTLTTLVSVDFYLAGITSLDEIAEKLTTTGFLTISWKDDYLTWTPASYGGITEFYYPQGNVWKPDISLQNGFNKIQELGSSFLVLNIKNTGIVTWQPYELLESKCRVDTTLFPFDKQTCKLVFTCWGYSPNQVNMTVGSAGIQLYDDFSSNGEWSVTKTSYSVHVDVEDARVFFSITIKRKSAYFVLNIMMPVVLLSMLNLFTFVIPSDGGERNSYAITVWLSFAVFLTIVETILPKSSSSTSFIAVYLMLQLLIGTFVVMVSAVQSRVSRYTTEDMEIPKSMIRMVLFLKRRKCCTNKVEKCEEKSDNSEDVQKSKDCWDRKCNVRWKDVVSAIDFILFWVCFIIVVLKTMICFCYIAAG